jgi:diaminohydroxyphosphoribosylaminopyrimidine deaminase/5-amino-6-(5-phosphoribosylamino)uracil reductase
MAGSGQDRRAEAGRPGAGRPARAEAGTDYRWLCEAIELSRRCPPSRSAFSVGAILVAADGRVIATGYSRERDPHDHAEEVALGKALAGGPRAAPVGPPPGSAGPRDQAGPPAGPGARLAGATLYSSLEPCAARASRPRTCAELIIAAGIGRVVIAWREPPVFVQGGGAARLRAAGVTVAEIPGLAPAARAVNAHLLPG